MNCVMHSLLNAQSVSGSKEYHFFVAVGIDLKTFVSREKESSFKGENSFGDLRSSVRIQ